MSVFLILIIIGAVTGRVEYKGDTLDYLWEEKIIWLIGNAEVKTPEVTTKAGTIKYDAKKDMVVASGNPILWVGKQEIQGEKMWYHLESGEGIVKNGRTEIQKGWFDGRIIKRVEPDVLNIDYGKFTTCEHTPPHYYFWGRELKVYVDDMMFTRPLILFVHKIPLFYAPFWWFPIKKGRQSGLLHPKIGSSSDKGRYVENVAYYWVINNWSDATFTLDYFEFRGPRVLLEGRWLILPAGSGSFNISYIAEQLPDSEEKTKRWAVDFEHAQSFARRFSLRAKGKFQSDVDYRVDYEEERLVQLDKILDSYLSASKSWDLIGTNFVVREWRNLASDSVKRLLPAMRYYLTNRRILGGNFSCSGSFTNSSMSEKYIQHFLNTASLSFPFKLFRYLFISPATSHTYTLEWPENLQKPHHSQYSITLSTNIYGRSIFKPEFRHKMTPRLSYSMVDTIRGYSFSVSNDFWLVIGEKKFSLATMSLVSTWNFEKNRVNPVSVSIYSTPFPLLNLRGFGTCKPYKPDSLFKFTNLVLSSCYSKKDFSVSMSYNWVPRDLWSDKSLEFNLSTKLTKNWKLSLLRRYDILAGEVISERFIVHRDLHCWEAVFNFDRYGERWRYDFKLRLKAIPEIKVGKTLFGLFL